jgi:hypothetical protein
MQGSGLEGQLGETVLTHAYCPVHHLDRRAGVARPNPSSGRKVALCGLIPLTLVTRSPS